jgi:uncharacterized protein (DUF305 family)
VAHKRLVLIAAVALGALVGLTACSSSGDQANPTTASTTAPATQAHNQADVMFAQHMIPHHQQAIQMSDMVLAKQGIDARVVDLANQIKAAQGPEIQQMQSWLSQWGMPTMPMMPGMMPGGGMMPGQSAMPSNSMAPGQSPTPSETGEPHHSDTPSQSPMPSGSMMPSGGMMPGGGTMPGMEGMPGMMSPDDMAALQNAQGVDASKLFLQQMIQHHQGALTMAQNEINTGQYPPAIDLARSIMTSQQQEITTMQNILASL